MTNTGLSSLEKEEVVCGSKHSAAPEVTRPTESVTNEYQSLSLQSRDTRLRFKMGGAACWDFLDVI